MIKMFRSFLLFPLSLNIPGKGLFRKLIGENKTYNGRPVYNHTQTGEVIFFKGEIFLSFESKNFNQFFLLQTITGEAVKAVIMRMTGQTSAL